MRCVCERRHIASLGAFRDEQVNCEYAVASVTSTAGIAEAMVNGNLTKIKQKKKKRSRDKAVKQLFIFFAFFFSFRCSCHVLFLYRQLLFYYIHSTNSSPKCSRLYG